MSIVDLAFQTLGRIGTVIGIAWFSYWLWDRKATRLIIHYWWETTLDPVQRRRFRRSLSVGLRNPALVNSEGIGYNRNREHIVKLIEQGWGKWPDAPLDDEVWHRLVEPAVPLRLTTRDVHCDGVWALRVMIYNRGSEPIDAEALDIDIELAGARGVKLLEWQADDHRFTQTRTTHPDRDVITDTLRMTRSLESKHKIRDELAVIFNSTFATEPPEVIISAQTAVNWKVHPHAPALTVVKAMDRRIKTAGRYAARALRRLG